MLVLDSIFFPLIYPHDTFVGKNKKQLREYGIYFLLYTVIKMVDSNKTQVLIAGKPI